MILHQFVFNCGSSNFLDLTVNLLVTCTKSKTLKPSPELHLGSIKQRNVERVAVEWIDRIERCRSEEEHVSRLYKGGHWSVVRELSRLGTRNATEPTKDVFIRVWVSSAGYGIVPFNSKIHSYSATFGGDQDPDSVSRLECTRIRSSTFSYWWELLSKWDGPSPGSPRTICGLLETHPGDWLVIVASRPYLSAMLDDISRACSTPGWKDRILIVSSTGDRIAELTDLVVPCDARLQNDLGGARHSLNIRIAKDIIMNVRPFARRRIHEYLQHKLCLGRIQRYSRKPMSDEEVRNFISLCLSNQRGQSATHLLRLLRSKGFACEQRRFHKIFSQVTGFEQPALIPDQ